MAPPPATRAESRRQAAVKLEEDERKQRAAAWVNSLGAINDAILKPEHASPFPELEVDVLGRASRSFLATVNAHAHALAATTPSPPTQAARERSAQRFEFIKSIRAQWCETTCAHEDVYCRVRGVAEVIDEEGSDGESSSSAADRKEIEADMHVNKKARVEAEPSPSRSASLVEVGGVPHFTAARWSDMISTAAGSPKPSPTPVPTGNAHKPVPSEIDVLVVGTGRDAHAVGEILERSQRTRVCAVEVDADANAWRPERVLAPSDVAPEYTLGVITSASPAARQIIRNTTVMAWLLIQSGPDDDDLLADLRKTHLPVICAASSRSDPSAFVTASMMGASSCTENALRVFSTLVRDAGASCLLADDMANARYELTMRDCASMCISSLSRGAAVPESDAVRAFVAEIVEVGCGAGLLTREERDEAIADVLADVKPGLELDLGVVAGVIGLAHEHKVEIPRLEFAYALLSAA
ncbi:hypothetical protein Q8F55_007226 [Vanrija albida]|uniref:Uncharacterized protein n=1 Tax=Vanrija albida TaxID=181172 RepID=A0ABR3PZU0_9TREE